MTKDSYILLFHHFYNLLAGVRAIVTALYVVLTDILTMETFLYTILTGTLIIKTALYISVLCLWVRSYYHQPCILFLEGMWITSTHLYSLFSYLQFLSLLTGLLIIVTTLCTNGRPTGPSLSIIYPVNSLHRNVPILS